MPPDSRVRHLVLSFASRHFPQYDFVTGAGPGRNHFGARRTSTRAAARTSAGPTIAPDLEIAEISSPMQTDADRGGAIQSRVCFNACRTTKTCASRTPRASDFYEFDHFLQGNPSTSRDIQPPHANWMEKFVRGVGTPKTRYAFERNLTVAAGIPARVLDRLE